MWETSDTAGEVTLNRSRLGLAAAALLCTIPGLARDAPAATPRTTRDRIYTTGQAERGKLVYKRACVQCHALAFYRGDIMKSWEDGSLLDLYDSIANTMPQANPGSLKRREYLEIVAYILSLNGMPAGGEELPARPDDLKGIRIRWRNKP